MKKRIRTGIKAAFIIMTIMLIFPEACCYIYHFIDPDFVIGEGSGRLEDHYMGKNVMIEVKGLYKNIDVEEYITGIMAGIIPADYEEEALKTQAVLVRTNVLKEMEEKGSNNAEDLSYEYLTKEDRERIWGRKKYDEYEERIEKAVVKTAGKVIKKENNLIMALYHEVSIGKTASALEILGEDISYLQSVDSSTDVEAKNYMNLYEFSYEDISNMKQEYDKETQLLRDNGSEPADNASEEGVQDLPCEDLHIIVEESTENGFVKKCQVGGTTYSGEEIEDMLSLASTNFYVEERDRGVRIVCLGKGNCLGVSQFGANCMAAKGSKMEDIIGHFYIGVNIENESRN